MSEYFSYFPTVEHDLTNVGQKVELTNILRRFIVKNNLQDRTDIFYDYNIQEGDRVDIIAEKYYGDAKLAWLILHFNNIKDPFFDLPLFGSDFVNYIKGKYGSVINAQSEIHEYRWITRESEVRFDGTKIPEQYFVIDETTYNSTSPLERRTIYKYDWELEQNEEKRLIKILDRRYVTKVKDEVQIILREGL